MASGSSSVDRMFQVNRDYFMKTRTSFACTIKRDREVPGDKCFQLESTLHRFFKSYQYEGKVKFDGCTELFCIPLEDAVMAYEAVIEGNEPDFTYVMPEVGEDNVPF